MLLPSFFQVPPIDKWRHGYLWVSHLVSQMWCEQQMEYGFTKKEAILAEPQHVIRGSELHLARELQSEDYVNVQVESNEDIFAIKVLNLYLHLSSIRDKKLSREVPIFGWIGELFLMGKIDELQWINDGLQISEFKTRTKPCLPGKSQLKTHEFQVMIYQYLLSNLLSIDTDLLCAKLKLSKDKNLGSDVIKFCPSADIKCLSDLLEMLHNLLDLFPCLTQVKHLKIDYSCQDDDAKVFATLDVNYDESWILKEIKHYQSYWLGDRFVAQGVDIEDAWKCSYCDFADDCEWRLAKINKK